MPCLKGFSHIFRFFSFFLFCGAVLTGCGGGGSDYSVQYIEPKTGFSVSGTISPASSSQVDGDTNDPFSINIDNDSFNTPQLLPNPVVVGGFVAAMATGHSGDRFATSTDVEDWYRIALAQGQTVTLTISDHGTAGAPNLDLFLLTAADPPVEVGSSEGVGSSESITVATSGEYYLVVSASSGYSNYLLSIGQAVAGASVEALRVEDDFVPGDLIVRFKDSSAELGPRAAALSLQAVTGEPGRATLLRLGDVDQRKAAFSALGIASVSKSKTLSDSADPKLQLKHDTIQTVKALRLREDVVSADLNYIRKPFQTPSDEFYPFQWHYPLLNLPQAWDITTGNSSVVVAVADTGVLMNHPDLNGRLCTATDDCRGYDFISDLSISLDGDGIDSNPDDPGDGSTAGSSSFHGTHVAGTIGAESNTSGSGSGVAGVTWSSRIMPLRVLGQGGGTSYDMMQSLLYAAGLANDSGDVPVKTADIINLSLGGGGSSQTEQDVFNQVRAQGVIVVAAAGNESSSLPSYPASYEGVISVSAVDMHKNLSYYSNTGTGIDVAAPGGDTSVDTNGDGFGDGVLSTLGDDSGATIENIYDFNQGTSMAAPHMAGVVALMKAEHPTLTPGDIDALISAGAITEDLVGDGAAVRNNNFGYGLIDAHKAVLQARSLAGGAPLPASLGVTPSALNFGNATTSLALETSNLGGGTLTVNSVTENADWLTVDDAHGLGTYTVMVDRGGLTDAIYSALISFNTSAGLYTVQVTMQVGVVNTNGDAGYHWVLLLDPEGGSLVEVTSVPLSGGRYQYRFNNVPAGNYLIMAGTDSDNDEFLCDAGEACSGFPLVNRLSEIVVSDSNVTGIDFISGFSVNLSGGALADFMIQSDGYSKYPGKRVAE